MFLIGSERVGHQHTHVCHSRGSKQFYNNANFADTTTSQVDLHNPDRTILVVVVRDKVALSVCRDWTGFKHYNVARISEEAYAETIPAGEE